MTHISEFFECSSPISQSLIQFTGPKYIKLLLLSNRRIRRIVINMISYKYSIYSVLVVCHTNQWFEKMCNHLGDMTRYLLHSVLKGGVAKHGWYSRSRYLGCSPAFYIYHKLNFVSSDNRCAHCIVARQKTAMCDVCHRQKPITELGLLVNAFKICLDGSCTPTCAACKTAVYSHHDKVVTREKTILHKKCVTDDVNHMVCYYNVPFKMQRSDVRPMINPVVAQRFSDTYDRYMCIYADGPARMYQPPKLPLEVHPASVLKIPAYFYGNGAHHLPTYKDQQQIPQSPYADWMHWNHFILDKNHNACGRITELSQTPERKDCDQYVDNTKYNYVKYNTGSSCADCEPSIGTDICGCLDNSIMYHKCTWYCDCNEPYCGCYSHESCPYCSSSS